jgi:hypothetical protein
MSDNKTTSGNQRPFTQRKHGKKVQLCTSKQHVIKTQLVNSCSSKIITNIRSAIVKWINKTFFVITTISEEVNELVSGNDWLWFFIWWSKSGWCGALTNMGLRNDSKRYFWRVQVGNSIMNDAFLISRSCPKLPLINKPKENKFNGQVGRFSISVN